MNPYQFQILGNQAADDFVKHKTPLNESIAKIAEEHDMTRLQIQRVIEVANHSTNDEFRKVAEDKTFTFPVAALEGVLEAMREAPVNAVASLSDIQSAIDGYHDPMNKIASEELRSDDDRLRTNRRAELALNKIAGWVDKYNNQLEARKLGQLEKLSEDLDNLLDMSKVYLTEKAYPLSDLRKYAEAVEDAPQVWDTVFNHVQDRLEKLGHPFTGILASDKELRSEQHEQPGKRKVRGGEVQVINGDTPIFKVLKLVHARVRDLSAYDLFKHELDSMSTVVELGRETLKDTKDFDRHFCEDLETMATQAVRGPKQMIKSAAPMLAMAKALSKRKAAKITVAAGLGLGAAALASKGVKALKKSRQAANVNTMGVPATAENNGNLSAK